MKILQAYIYRLLSFRNPDLGEGGMTPIRLTSDEERKVPAALGLWGFNMVASDKVNMDRIPADLRMPGYF